LREALARSDLDFVVAEAPRRKPRTAASPKAPASGPARVGRFLLAFLTRRPARTLAGVTIAAVATGIILNAALFQTGRHPAPLFGAPGVTTAVLKPATPPMPAPRPVAMAQQAPVAPASAPAAVAAPTARAPENVVSRAAEPAPAVQRKDPIGALIKGDGIGEPVVPPARVAAVQKALVKAGFVLRADGVMGATTKQALERFEREHKLPVTGDLAPRTLRELAAQSGVPIP
jgi:hypothetical protein